MKPVSAHKAGLSIFWFKRESSIAVFSWHQKPAVPLSRLEAPSTVPARMLLQFVMFLCHADCEIFTRDMFFSDCHGATACLPCTVNTGLAGDPCMHHIAPMQCTNQSACGASKSITVMQFCGGTIVTVCNCNIIIIIGCNMQNTSVCVSKATKWYKRKVL